MKRGKYFLNPETLKFEKIQKSLKQRIKEFFISTAIIGGVVISMRLVVDESFTSPKLKLLVNQNKALHDSYLLLNQKIGQAENLLKKIRLRDDKLYRSVFDLEPIPGSVREAGFGGSQTFDYSLESRSDDFVNRTARKLDQLSNKAKIQSNSLSHLYDMARDQKLLLANQPSIQPISPADHVWLTSTFGYRSDPFHKRRKMHQGIDLAGEVGIKIYATGNGVVRTAEYSRHGYGNEVVIGHGFGLESIYAHLDEIMVQEGDSVKKGQLIGTLGNTGRSTGPHLHYEIRKDDSPVNPMYFFYENISIPEYSLITQINR